MLILQVLPKSFSVPALFCLPGASVAGFFGTSELKKETHEIFDNYPTL